MLRLCIAHFRTCEGHALQVLLSSSHTVQQAAAVTRTYSTNNGSEAGDIQTSETEIFDAAEHSSPLRVHQLIGDPRTGVADDTTTAPFGEDVSVEWIWSSDSNGVDWYRYSLAGDHLPFMYMDSRLSDASKNLMYMLRCKDPNRWTIQALADKFRVRRQRVMSILALKELQAHRIHQGLDMQGPLAPYVFNIPLRDFNINQDGEPVDLQQLVAQQQAAVQQQQPPAAAAAAGLQDVAGAAEGLGSLEDYLAPAETAAAGTEAAAGAGAAGAQAAAPDLLSSIGAAAAHQAADLATLMPQITLVSQQLQLQLLQLLQRHNYSVEALQRHLLQQVDLAEAYYKAHVAGTPLEQILLQQAASGHQQQADAAAAAAADGEADAAGEAGPAESSAIVPPAWLDFAKQRQEIQQLLLVLEPLLATAGLEQDRQSGRLFDQLKTALTSQAAAPAAEAAEPSGDQQPPQQQQQQQVVALVGSADAAVLARAFNQLGMAQRQQLIDLAPEARIKLNIRGTDLKAALTTSSTSSTSDGQAESSSSKADSSSSSEGISFTAPGRWPGQLPPVVDVWGYEDISQQQLSALQQQVPALQSLLGQLNTTVEGLGAASPGSSSSSSRLGVGDLEAVQQAVQVYSGLLFEYDKVLTAQAAAAVGGSAPRLPPSSQRRLIRILRELDVNAIEKLLLWESYFKEEEAADEGDERDARRLRRLKLRVKAALKALDQQAAALGQADPYAEYPDLPGSTPPAARMDKDMMAAHLDAEVVGRQFHRGSGDRHFVRVTTYPKFEGLSLEEFDRSAEGELSLISRLAAEREDEMMWKEFRQQLLRNMGLLGPKLHQHSGVVKPPKPQDGWSWVVHPVGGAARALTRQQLKQQAQQQWLPEDQLADAQPGSWGAVSPPVNPATGPSPAAPYVAEPDGGFRGLNEEEALVVGDTRAKPRRRWYASRR